MALILREGEIPADLSEFFELVNENARGSVLRVNPEPLADAHFAAYPTGLVRPCVLLSTSERGCCPECGAPWTRVFEEGEPAKGWHDIVVAEGERSGATDRATGRALVMNEMSVPREPIGWQPSCGCGTGLAPDDLEIICTPRGTKTGDDPTATTGRKGMNRPRGDRAGVRPMTRYEQRRYAAQLRESPHRAAMEREAGPEAFAHYLRTDRTGARAIPPDLLAAWMERGWLTRVDLPTPNPPAPVPCTVLDLFTGSGRTGEVAVAEGRRFIGFELAERYAGMARRRIGAVASQGRMELL